MISNKITVNNTSMMNLHPLSKFSNSRNVSSNKNFHMTTKSSRVITEVNVLKPVISQQPLNGSINSIGFFSDAKRERNYNVGVLSAVKDLITPLAFYHKGDIIDTFAIKGSILYKPDSVTRYVFGLSKDNVSKPDIIFFEGSAEDVNNGLIISNITIEELNTIVLYYSEADTENKDAGHFNIKINC